MNKIVGIIREEMDKIGGQEVYLSSFQGSESWATTARWNLDTVWFKTKLRSGSDLGLAFTHEEPLTNLMKDHIRSFRDLPVFPYQFQTKFRNEERAKSGILRGREFLMKDLYSFCRDEKEHLDFYEKAKGAYRRIFDRLGIGGVTFVTFASGGSFAKYSHEFQTLCDAGEDTVYVDEQKRIAVNKEVLNDDVLADLGLRKGALVEKKAVEVGNIFSLGTRFSDALGLNYKDEAGKSKSPIMGSYGIGPGRAMGTIVEIHADDKGLVWPDGVAPFAVHLVAIFDKEGKVKSAADDLYEKLVKKGIEVLYDDRDLAAGEKLNDSDLIGIPKRHVVSEKTLKESKIEIRDRRTGKVELISES
jgi:prolyl-tRNA synthetase